MTLRKHKNNIIILNSCHLSKYEAMLWNSFYDLHKAHFDFIFFSAMPTPGLQVPNIVALNYGDNLFTQINKDITREFTESSREISACDTIWEHYDPVRSPKLAAAWLCYWLAILKLYSPAAVYIWNGYHAPEAALKKACDLLGVKRYLVERGPFAGTFAFDQRGVNYQSSFVQRYSDYKTEFRGEAVARFSQLYLSGNESNWAQPARVDSRPEFLRRYGIPDDKIVVFFPAQVQRDSNSKLFSPFYETVFEAYAHLAETLRPYSDKVFLLAKKHPLQESCEKFAAVPLVSGAWVDDAHIFDCISHADAVVSINSSAVVEAALLGKPVLILGQSILGKNTSAIHLTHRTNLVSCIDKLLDLAEKGAACLDGDYFARLLFAYLYSPISAYNELNIMGTAKIPFPHYDSPPHDVILPLEVCLKVQELMDPNMARWKLKESDGLQNSHRKNPLQLFARFFRGLKVFFSACR